MKLNIADRAALVNAIQGNADGERVLGNDRHSNAFLALCVRLENGTESAKDTQALRYLPSLPYTQPPIDDDSTDEEFAMMARLLLAYFKVEGSHNLISVRPDTAIQEMLLLLS